MSIGAALMHGPSIVPSTVVSGRRVAGIGTHAARAAEKSWSECGGGGRDLETVNSDSETDL
jgi:hypothetical protein